MGTILKAVRKQQLQKPTCPQAAHGTLFSLQFQAPCMRGYHSKALVLSRLKITLRNQSQLNGLRAPHLSVYFLILGLCV